MSIKEWELKGLTRYGHVLNTLRSNKTAVVTTTYDPLRSLPLKVRTNLADYRPAGKDLRIRPTRVADRWLIL